MAVVVASGDDWKAVVAVEAVAAAAAAVRRYWPAQFEAAEAVAAAAAERLEVLVAAAA